ncbi:MAG: hypothetical protein M0P94_05165, partial [Candidatus Absconditabacterales bacterium]|nr:hypothetical protein [Candidatus Absconditabacterales bacterium]
VVKKMIDVKKTFETAKTHSKKSKNPVHKNIYKIQKNIEKMFQLMENKRGVRIIGIILYFPQKSMV